MRHMRSIQTWYDILYNTHWQHAATHCSLYRQTCEQNAYVEERKNSSRTNSQTQNTYTHTHTHPHARQHARGANANSDNATTYRHNVCAGARARPHISCICYSHWPLLIACMYMDVWMCVHCAHLHFMCAFVVRMCLCVKYINARVRAH